MLLFCIGSISWCCFVILLFCCSSHDTLFRGIPIVPALFCCSVIVLVFHQHSGFLSVFHCSAVVPCSIVPCSGVPGFIVCLFDPTWTQILAPKGPSKEFCKHFSWKRHILLSILWLQDWLIKVKFLKIISFLPFLTQIRQKFGLKMLQIWHF